MRRSHRLKRKPRRGEKCPRANCMRALPVTLEKLILSASHRPRELTTAFAPFSSQEPAHVSYLSERKSAPFSPGRAQIPETHSAFERQDMGKRNNHESECTVGSWSSPFTLDLPNRTRRMISANLVSIGVQATVFKTVVRPVAANGRQ